MDRNAVTAHRVSSARWPRSTTGRTAAGTPGRPRNAPPRPSRTPAAAPRNGHSGSNGADPTAPGHAPDHEHGPNGFDLHALSGNLCRCTGYRPIRDAAYALGQPAESDPLFARLDRPAPAPAATRVTSSQGAFARPADLAEALDLLAENPAARVLAGSTDWGVELNIRHSRAALTIGIDRLEELRQFAVGPDSIDIGAA